MSLPPEVASDAQILRESPGSTGSYSPASRVVNYIVAPASSQDRAKNMNDARAALGTDAAGERAFERLLYQGQSGVVDPTTSARMHEAFATNVADGRLGPNDARGMVDDLARYGGAGPADAAGLGHPAMSQLFARVSSYVDHLGNDSRSVEFRNTFAEAALSQAQTHAGDRPGLCSQLYAAAANAMADMSPADRDRRLAELARGGPDAVARFASGAAAGEAERANYTDHAAVVPGPPLRSDGLATVLNGVNAEIAAASTAGRGNPTAERRSAELFTGTTAFLTAARGGDLDTALGRHDDRTGLRHALTGSIDANFPTILRENMLTNGEGLDPKGFDTFASYSRFEFGAPNDKHGRETAREAQEAIGDKIGRIQGGLLQSAHDGGRTLHRDFGSAFGESATAPTHASRVLGELMGSVQNGINMDFDVRADRADDEQRRAQDGLERAGNLAAVAAKVAGWSGQEEIAGGLEMIEKTTDALKAGVPRGVTGVPTRATQIGDLRDAFITQLGNHGKELADPLQVGADHAQTRFDQYENTRGQNKTAQGAEATHETPLGMLLSGTIVPSPGGVAEPGKTEHLTPAQKQERLGSAIAEFNKEHPDRRLPPARETNDWDGSKKVGTVLDLKDGNYAISTGRGNYETFTAEQINGVRPVLGERSDLERNGTIAQREVADPARR